MAVGKPGEQSPQASQGTHQFNEVKNKGKPAGPVYVRDNDLSGDYSLDDQVLIPKKGGGHKTVTVREFISDSSSRFTAFGSSPQDRLNFITSKKVYERSQHLKGQTTFTKPKAEVSEGLTNHIDALRDKAALMSKARQHNTTPTWKDVDALRNAGMLGLSLHSGESVQDMAKRVQEAEDTGRDRKTLDKELDFDTDRVSIFSGKSRRITSVAKIVDDFVAKSNGVWSREEIYELNALMGNSLRPQDGKAKAQTAQMYVILPSAAVKRGTKPATKPVGPKVRQEP